jgi:uncharacterized repeat protein (TIGR03803 family)
VEGPDGNFYGTQSGGASGNGTVFRITPAGQLTTLHSFGGSGTASTGSGPYSGLALDADGNFYGTTMRGGDFSSGIVFRITPSGTLTKLRPLTASI